jgi:hypothetical protein
MRLVGDVGDSKYYIKQNDKMKIGDADLNKTEGGFIGLLTWWGI